MILIGLVTVIAVLMALAVPRIRGMLKGARCEPQGSIAGASDAGAVTS
jgi:hypothetical protein